MFTGIIETLGKVVSLEKEQENLHIRVSSDITGELKIDQSVAHNGVCLTVVEIEGDQYVVTAVKETLDRSNINDLNTGDEVNLERCMVMGARLDGHMVQGHVDTTAEVVEIKSQEGSFWYRFRYTEGVDQITVEKGSITVNGVSLTVVDSWDDGFSVIIIPFTREHTNFKHFEVGTRVNIEFDIIGKYILKHQSMLDR